MSEGQVRIRSNVVLDAKRWDLVPGELLKRLPWSASGRQTRRQHDEHMYYEPCSICQLTIVSINLSGCTRCCHAPRPEQVELVRNEWNKRVEAAKAREKEENAALTNFPDSVST